jgi:hypothetical protein
VRSRATTCGPLVGAEAAENVAGKSTESVGGRPASKAERRLVGANDPALSVENHHRHRSAVEDRRKLALTLDQRLLDVTALVGQSTGCNRLFDGMAD